MKARLVALSSAAILAVYTAGYLRTRSAAGRFELEAAERRPARPIAEAPIAPVPSAVAAAAPNRIRAKNKGESSPTVRPKADTTSDSTSETVRLNADTTSEISPKADTSTEIRLEADTTAITSASEPQAAVPEPLPSTAVVQAPAPPPAPSLAQSRNEYRDGTYYGWGTSRHGDIQAEVIVENGRISATISQCRTRYPCSVIVQLPPQVAARQSPKVDYVSGATQSADAFYYAVLEALSKAR